MRNFLILITIVATLFSCQQEAKYVVQGNEVFVDTEQGKVLVEVISDEILRCVQSGADSIEKQKSKIVDFAPAEKVEFNVESRGEQVIISTSKISALVGTKSGLVTYQDNSGKVILSEKSNAFSENTINGFSTQSVEKQFNTDPEEGIYGLGQNQIGKMNLNGRYLNLYQQNTSVVVPYWVSTKGYGILWDNYAHSQFCKENEPVNMPSKVFMDTLGNEGRLSVETYYDRAFRKPSNFEGWNGDSLLNESVSGMDSIYSVRLTGKINLDVSGEYEFHKVFSGVTKIWMDGELVSDYWHLFSRDRRVSYAPLEKGIHDIKIEFISRNAPGENIFDLKWVTPDRYKKDSYSMWSASAKNMDYYFVYGENADDLISGYRKLTGKATMLPKWAFGLWQSRERYKTQEEIVNVVKEYRKRKIPLDNIVQDWEYWKPGHWGSHEFESTRFPDPKKMIEDIHSMNANIMISAWGKFHTKTKNFQELQKAGFTYPNHTADSIEDKTGHYGYYDAFNEDARKMYWDQMNNRLYQLGIDAWWLDATEPTLDKHQTPEQMARHMTPNGLGMGHDYLNLYAFYTCKGVYEGQLAVSPSKRPFILTRSGFAGLQRYSAATWSGDIVAHWDIFRNQISSGLNFGLSGTPYWTTDIGAFFPVWGDEGGFYNDEYHEMFTRWFQYGAFCPLFRVHGASRPREMWEFGDASYDIQLKYDKLRYDLMPYIYSLAGDITHRDYTMMRALVMDFPADQNVLDIGDQFMFGPSIMISPVTEYEARSREVYLPNSTGWYDFHTGKYYEGGQQVDMDAPLSDIPILVKEGSIIPFGPELQYTSEKPADTIDLWVYEGRDAEFTLYEDDGITLEYGQGQFMSIKLTWVDSEKKLTIGDIEGEYSDMLAKRTFKLRFIDQENAKGYSRNSESHGIVKYSGQPIVYEKG